MITNNLKAKLNDNQKSSQIQSQSRPLQSSFWSIQSQTGWPQEVDATISTELS